MFNDVKNEKYNDKKDNKGAMINFLFRIHKKGGSTNKGLLVQNETNQDFFFQNNLKEKTVALKKNQEKKKSEKKLQTLLARLIFAMNKERITVYFKFYILKTIYIYIFFKKNDNCLI